MSSAVSCIDEECRETNKNTRDACDKKYGHGKVEMSRTKREACVRIEKAWPSLILQDAVMPAWPSHHPVVLDNDIHTARGLTPIVLHL